MKQRLASVVPAVALAWLSFLVYGVVVNVAGWPVMGRLWFGIRTFGREAWLSRL